MKRNRLVSRLGLVWLVAALALAACSTPRNETATPASLQVNGVTRVNTEDGSADLSVSAFDASGDLIEKGALEVVSVTVDDVAVAGASVSPAQAYTATAEICAPIAARDSLRGILTLDATLSMEWNDPDELRGVAARAFADRVRPVDEFAVASFSYDTTSTAVYAPPGYYHLHSDFTADASVLYDAIDEALIYPELSGTPFYRAAYYLIDELGEKGERVLLMLTDGEDTVGGISPTSVIEHAIDSGVTVYIVGLGGGLHSHGQLATIAQATGGIYQHSQDPEGLEAMFTKVWQAAAASGCVTVSFDPVPAPGTLITVTVVLEVAGVELPVTAEIQF